MADESPATPLGAAPARSDDASRSHQMAVAVIVIGLVITAVVSWTAWSLHNHDETRLLKLQTEQAGEVIAAALPSTETPMATALQVAVASSGSPSTFKRYLAVEVGANKEFTAASLWRFTGTTAQPIALMGTPGASSSEMARAAVARAAQVPLLVVNQAQAAGQRLLTYALGLTGSPFVVYAQRALPADRKASVASSSAFSEINYAIYLGKARSPANLLATSFATTSPSGATDSVQVPYGDSTLTLVAAARSPLDGTLPGRLPWIFGVLGVLITAAAAAAAERLVRRRHEAERLASENQRLFAEQHTISSTLQHSLLPQETPSIAGVEIAVRYIPGVDGIDIGGDWYDVIPLDDTHFVFVVGDVSGRGLRAATIMASLRYAIRAYALEGHPPATVPDKLSTMLSIAKDGHFATVLCGSIDLERHEVTIANAGHLDPLFLNGSGTTYLETNVGPPIGVASPTPYAPVTATIPHHTTLIAFTDGLVERRGESLDIGLERLHGAIAGEHGSLDDLLTKVVADLGGASQDDTAILGLRWLS